MTDRTELDNLKQGALDWCNEIRAAKGQEPLDTLPKGAQHDPKTCPCGAATGVSVGCVAFAYPDELTDEEGEEVGEYQWAHRLPTPVQEFVLAFDGGAFPELEL